MNKSTHRTTHAEFLRFKRKFKETQARLGLTGWGIAFKLCPLESMAEIEMFMEAKKAVVKLVTKFHVDDPDYDLDFESAAIHECAHLFLFQLEWLAYQRFTTKCELSRVGEEMTRTLEAALGKNPS